MALQYPVIKAVAEHPQLKYRLLVSGAHLDPNFGKSVNEIIDDGFEIEGKNKYIYGPSSGNSHSPGYSICNRRS